MNNTTVPQVGKTWIHKISRWQYIALALISLMGIYASVLMFWITSHGPGIYPDSVTYIETARNLLLGNGFLADGLPMTHYPPLYPLLLAMLGFFQDIDILQAARLLCILLFGINTVLLGLVVFICSNRSLLASICTMCIFLFSEPVVQVHSAALSEAPFITFTLFAFLLLSLHIARPNLYLIFAASLSIACAIATRYVGITILLPLVCGIMFLGSRTLKQKICDTFIATSIVLAPISSWVLHNFLTAGTGTNRTFAIHLLGFQHVKQLIFTIYSFIMPIPVSPSLKEILTGMPIFLIGIFALLIGLIGFLFLRLLASLHKNNYIKHHAHTVHIVLSSLCLIFSFSYVLFVMVSISFFDAMTSFDCRILLPVFLAIMVVCIFLTWSVSSVLQSQGLLVAFLLMAFLSIVFNGIISVPAMIDIHENGSGYNSKCFQNSEIIAAAGTFKKDIKIYSNIPDAVLFLAGKTADSIPWSTNPWTLKANQTYEKQWDIIEKELEDGNAIVLCFNGVKWKRWIHPLRALDPKRRMPVLVNLNDGIIYGVQRKGVASQGDTLRMKYLGDAGKSHHFEGGGSDLERGFELRKTGLHNSTVDRAIFEIKPVMLVPFCGVSISLQTHEASL
ncbi:MAG: hypothetical protein A2X49_17120 [Lentisphaerae bacterium GWF2_52_8]|nr:MAG: hypothetical protein A2X49_17120 [Lentisphaerae bacterium GWF2_52_8]